MIESPMVPVIIARDKDAQDWVRKLSDDWEKSGTLARALQPFTVQIPHLARETLRTNGKGDFVAPDLRGDAFALAVEGVVLDEVADEDQGARLAGCGRGRDGERADGGAEIGPVLQLVDGEMILGLATGATREQGPRKVDHLRFAPAFEHQR